MTNHSHLFRTDKERNWFTDSFLDKLTALICMNSLGSSRTCGLFKVASYDMVKNSSARTGGASVNLTSDIESGKPVCIDSRVSC